MTASSVYQAPSSQSKRKLEISFGGCGFLGVYHVGVGKCVVDHVPHLFDEFSGFYGASAGAITAVCAACKSDPMVPYKWVKKTFEASREHKLLGALHPSFNLYARLREFLEGFLPQDAHKLCRGKVRISMTTFDEKKTFPEPKNWLISNFTTRTELINIIIASSFIPGYAGLKDLPKVRGKGESHSPHYLHIVDQPLQLSTHNLHRLMTALIPTHWSDLEDLFYSGYKDAYRFFKLEGIISESLIRPLRRRSTLPETTSNGAAAKNSSTGVVAVAKNSNSTNIFEKGERDDSSSDYFSQCSDVATASCGHRRKCSITVSINGDFFSCLDNDDDDNKEVGGAEATDGGQKGKVPSYLRSLWREMDLIMKDIERARRQEAMENETPSTWSRFMWVVRKCYHTRVPLVGALVGSRGNDPTDPNKSDDFEDSWDSELSDQPGILHSIASSWSSSMTVM